MMENMKIPIRTPEDTLRLQRVLLDTQSLLIDEGEVAIIGMSKELECLHGRLDELERRLLDCLSSKNPPDL